MKSVKVQFVNFWKGQELENYVFLELFQQRYNQQIVNNDADIVIVADRISNNPKVKKRADPRQYNGVKVFYTGENTIPDLTYYDFTFSHQKTTETNFQLPNFARCKYFFDFQKQQEPNTFQRKPKTKFCNFIYRNKAPQARIDFCRMLSNYKRVDCPGEVLNNMPNFTNEGRRAKTWLRDKRRFVSNYKFTIAFENESSHNWITEKIFDAFYVGSIPIYWGAPNVNEFFNPDSFINVNDFNTFDEAVEYVKEVDNNDELYQRMRNAPAIHNTSRLKECTEENILARFETIVKATQK